MDELERRFRAVEEAHQLRLDNEDQFYRRVIVCSCGVCPGNPTRHILDSLTPSVPVVESVEQRDPRESQIDWRGEAS